MGLEEKLPGGILLSTVEKVAGYVRKGSLWPATFGLACCAIEMMATAGPRFDIARFGMERFSATPRQADLMIVAGRVSQKMAPVLRQVYDQMAEPKWVLAMGVCASSGGMFNNYAVVQGVDHVVPVDIYLPGLPAAARDAAQRNPQAARQDSGDAARRQPGRGHRRRRAGRARVADRPSSSRDCCGHDGIQRQRRRRHRRCPRGHRHAARHVRRRRAAATRPATAGSSARSRCRAVHHGRTAATSTTSSTR